MTHFEADVQDLAKAMQNPVTHRGRFLTRFTIGDRVNIDGCASITAIVTCIEIRTAPVVRYEVSWIDCSKVEFVVFDEWRLSAAAS